MIGFIVNDCISTPTSLINEHYNKGFYIDFAIRNMHYPFINPRGIGYQKCPPEYGKDYYHTRNTLIVHYVVSGEGTLFSRGKEFPVKAGEAFLICADETVIYQASATNPWEYIWLAFDGEVTKDFDAIENPVFKTNGEIFERAKECINYSNTREIYLMGCITELYCSIFDTSEEISIVSAIKNYINTNYMLNIKVSDIATSLNISRSQLTRIFKNKTGESPREYILRQKMKAAKKLLESGRNVSETAQLLGYSDQPNFSKAFKKYYGYSPSEKNNI